MTNSEVGDLSEQVPEPLRRAWRYASRRWKVVTLAWEQTSESAAEDWPRCRCYFPLLLLSIQRVRAAYADLLGYALDEVVEGAVEGISELQGWDSLRGRYGRRQFLEEELGEPEVGRGGPRRLFLGPRAVTLAAGFLNHARNNGVDHVRQELGSVVILPEWDPEVEHVKVYPMPARFASETKAVLEVVEAACDLTDDRYEYRQGSLARKVVARIAGVSEDAVRKAEQGEEPPWTHLDVLGSGFKLGHQLAVGGRDLDEDLEDRCLEQLAQEEGDPALLQIRAQKRADELDTTVEDAKVDLLETGAGLTKEEARQAIESGTAAEIYRDSVSYL